jgi:uncharacterized membrane protein
MPKIYFLLFELTIYIQFALCLRHAWKHGTANLLKLFVGTAFGVLLELASIRQLNAYHYGQFLFMVLDVPLCIGIAWSCIIYAVMEFSDGSSLPYWTRPILDGLLALNIDLALDTIAIRLGFWDWGQGLHFQYFGVPYANFWAWFWVVSSFSLGYRLLAQRSDWIGIWLSPFLGIVIGLAWVIFTNAFITYIIPFDYHTLTIAPVLIGALVVIIASRPRFYQSTVDPLAFWVPFLTHFYLLIAGLVSGVIFDPPALLWIALSMVLLALVLHKPSIQHSFSQVNKSNTRNQ